MNRRDSPKIVETREMRLKKALAQVEIDVAAQERARLDPNNFVKLVEKAIKRAEDGICYDVNFSNFWDWRLR